MADGGGKSERFTWDGLALVRRGDATLINEPHVGGGNPVVSSLGATYFNDVLGTTVGARRQSRYAANSMTAFGEGGSRHAFFTGKPQVDGLGHAFLFRNYRASLGKWQTADPMGYPDGWNRLEYGVNSPLTGVDLFGASWGNSDFLEYYFCQDPSRSNYIDIDSMGLTSAIYSTMSISANSFLDMLVKASCPTRNGDSSRIGFNFGVDCKSIVYALGGGCGSLLGMLSWTWQTTYESVDNHLYETKHYTWVYSGAMKYSDSFSDPIDVLNFISSPDLEVPGGRPYDYGHVWSNVSFSGNGIIYRKQIE